MKTQKYQLKLIGLPTASGTISVKALGEVCNLILEATERGLRLAVEGYSVKPGKLPSWLEKSLDFTITGLKKGSTALAIEAPVLAETARDQIRQQDLWYVVPQPSDTALSLLAKSVHDTTTEKLDSNTYDGGVLDSLLDFKKILRIGAKKVELKSVSRPNDRFALGTHELERIQRLKAKIPEPRAIVVSGHFNLIEHQKKRFHLLLKNGETIIGTIDPEFLDAEQMRTLWGTKVTIKGTAYFRPSGKMRLIEAQVIKHMEEGEEVFETIPEQQIEADFIKNIMGNATNRQGWLKDVWGKWPGDEPIEELLAALNSN